MYFLEHNVIKTLFLLTIVLSSIIALGETSGEKKLNLRLGFDLTQGKNGAPSLRIRDFEDTSEFNPRAVDVETDEVTKRSAVIRADSFSDSNDNAPEETSKQAENVNRKSDNDEDYDSGDGNRIRSTKGLDVAGFEPADTPSLHSKYKAPASSESDDNHKRRKRAAGLYELLKKKSKKMVSYYKKKLGKS